MHPGDGISTAAAIAGREDSAKGAGIPSPLVPPVPWKTSSLRGLLTGWLIWPLATLVLASAVPTYYLALGAANAAYDSALLDPALAISNHVMVKDHQIVIDLPASALDALRIDTRDRIFVHVSNARGDAAAGATALPPPDETIPERGHIFYNGTTNGERIRIAALRIPHPGGPILVQVAETYVKRNIMVREMLFAMLASELLVAAAAVGLLWLGIARGLAPLDRLREEIEARSTQDLSPVVIEDKPAEVKPVIAALNQLLYRLNATIQGQQRFIANAAHQLRTPLAGLKTHAELASRQPSTPELRALLDMIAGETERTSHLINQLLTLARAEPEGTSAESSAPVNLHEVANRVAQDWVPRAMARDIDLGFELEDAWILGDALLLRELLANLVDNSLAYTPSKGSVTVRTYRRGPDAVVEVEDDGPGIPLSERSRVFERFYRALGTVGEGCGLGLAIVHEITHRHGGSVEIQTPASGKGTLLRARFACLQHG